MAINKHFDSYTKEICGVLVHFVFIVDRAAWWADIEGSRYGTWIKLEGDLPLKDIEEHYQLLEQNALRLLEEVVKKHG